MGDVIDVTLDSNKHVVQCIVNVLNILAEFINRERKMEEKRAKENKSAEAKAANKGLPSALNEEEKKELPDSTEVPKDV
jgi:F0F1-type ATP synthase epsilon subunit